MNLSMKRTMAILQKDMKDLRKNMFVSTTLLLPLLIAFIYNQAGISSLAMHYTVINLTFASVTAFVQCTLIAEEKEKNTLRSLMLSPANIWEILGGKSILTFIVTIVTIILCLMLTGYEPLSYTIIAVSIGLSTLFYVGLGTLLGLLTNSVTEASVAILPIIFLLGFSTMLENVMRDYPALQFMEYLPNLQLLEIAAAVENQAPVRDILLPLAVITGWTIVAISAVFIAYQKNKWDD